MLIEFFPAKQTPPRQGGWWINGIKINPFLQDLSKKDYDTIKDSEIFISFVKEGIIVLPKSKEFVVEPSTELPEVLPPSPVPEIIPEPTLESPSLPSPEPIEETVTEIKIGGLSHSEALSQVKKSNSLPQLDNFKDDEMMTKQRKAILDAINNKIKELNEGAN